MTGLPQILRPFDKREAMTVELAATLADRSTETIRDWCKRYMIGRKVGGAYAVSRVALAMYLDDDPIALRAYLAGDRASEDVVCYFRRFGLKPENQESGKTGNPQNRQNPP